jgi:rRNA maturation endonuclease Nob1
MPETIPTPKAGDPCPACGGAFSEYRAPTAVERAAADDKERRQPYPARVDSATEADRAELGPLHVCDSCGYQTRIKAPKDKPASDGK